MRGRERRKEGKGYKGFKKQKIFFSYIYTSIHVN
jgi:hypothetical protein